MKSGQLSKFRTLRTSVRSSITTSTSAAVVQGYTFQLADVPNFAEFTSLFDVYRIKSVELIFIPRVDTSTTGDIYADPRLYTAIDYDSASPASVNEILEYETCQVHDIRRGFTLKLEPRTSINTNSSGLATAANEMWIDCASTTVNYFGVLVGTVAQQAVTVITVTARYELEFMASR